MNYFIVTANRIDIAGEPEPTPSYWSRSRIWMDEKALAKRYRFREQAESVSNKLSTKKFKNISVEEMFS